MTTQQLHERIRPGLCSVSFRELSPEKIVDLCADSRLQSIEWGSDVHVPIGDLETANSVRELTLRAGLSVAGYGSYLSFGHNEEPIRDAAETAAALGAPRIRVWAGKTPSADATAGDRREIARRIRVAAAAAAESGVELGLEFHGGTLTDDAGSTLDLLAEVDHPNLRTYWQPPQGMPTDESLESLKQVLHQASTVHVFSWWPTYQRHPLSERDDLWQRAMRILSRSDRVHNALIEFVPDDDPDLLPEEARTLRSYIEETE